MAAADERHLDDLALDQLDAIIWSQDADLGHPVVLRPREASSRCHHFHGRRHPPGSSLAQHIAETRTPWKVPERITARRQGSVEPSIVRTELARGEA
jgi:hypothetical protein